MRSILGLTSLFLAFLVQQQAAINIPEANVLCKGKEKGPGCYCIYIGKNQTLKPGSRFCRHDPPSLEFLYQSVDCRSSGVELYSEPQGARILGGPVKKMKVE
ncbi:hypothetical protein H4Q26_017693 [Puccinia striiformis f. sp. tritici PST-130]|nr:hypothetical protein H4Q26_017693 [Puccinia striiformis f. sp. tritici PST-130]